MNVKGLPNDSEKPDTRKRLVHFRVIKNVRVPVTQYKEYVVMKDGSIQRIHTGTKMSKKERRRQRKKKGLT